MFSKYTETEAGYKNLIEDTYSYLLSNEEKTVSKYTAALREEAASAAAAVSRYYAEKEAAKKAGLTGKAAAAYVALLEAEASHYAKKAASAAGNLSLLFAGIVAELEAAEAAVREAAAYTGKAAAFNCIFYASSAAFTAVIYNDKAAAAFSDYDFTAAAHLVTAAEKAAAVSAEAFSAAALLVNNICRSYLLMKRQRLTGGKPLTAAEDKAAAEAVSAAAAGLPYFMRETAAEKAAAAAEAAAAEDVKNLIRDSDYGYVELSSATLRDVDIITAYIGFLEDYYPAAAAAVKEAYPYFFFPDYTVDSIEEAAEEDITETFSLLDMLSAYLTAVCPENYYFGNNAGNGSDIGFWYVWED